MAQTKDDEFSLELKVVQLQRSTRLAMTVSVATLLLAAGGTGALFRYVDRASGAGGTHGASAATKEGDGGGHGAAKDEGSGAANHGAASGANGAEEVDTGQIFTLPVASVNLLDAANVRYVQVEVAVEAAQPAVIDEIKMRQAQFNDSVLTVLGNRTFADLQGVYGKNQVREELLQRFNKMLTSGRLTRLYFNKFLVQ